jgi:uncharacterized membrane protein YoaK (UPF0700 family)
MMEEAALSPLARWENFYVIIGSSAGALTGLQFVVIALIAEGRTPGSMREIRAFGSPTIVHFCASLLISAILSAPWHTLHGVGIALAICGAAGVIYSLNVVRHARLTTHYKPDAEDWIWYLVSPLVLYAAWTASALLLAWNHTSALFTIAAVALLLLFLGIHNAWDSVTYIAIAHSKRGREE